MIKCQGNSCTERPLAGCKALPEYLGEAIPQKSSTLAVTENFLQQQSAICITGSCCSIHLIG